MSHNFKNWPIVTGLTLVTIPILFMYVFLFVDTVTDTRPGEMIPNRFTLEHWRFLWENIEGKASVWLAMLNTMIFASSVTLIVLSVSSTASYAISRLNIPFRKEFLAGILMLHAFPLDYTDYCDFPDFADGWPLQHAHWSHFSKSHITTAFGNLDHERIL